MGHRGCSTPAFAASHLMEVGTIPSPRDWEHPEELSITAPAPLLYPFLHFSQWRQNPAGLV